MGLLRLDRWVAEVTRELRPLTDVVTHALDRGEISGATVLVAKDGKVVHADARGVLDLETGFPLATDSVLWLASLSKFVCVAALMTLVDVGAVQLSDPVSQFVPEFALPGQVRVLAPGSPPVVPRPPFSPPPDPMPQWDRVPADREIVVRDLLTHTSGLQTIFVYNPDYHGPRPSDTLASHVPTLASVPRDFQAGTAWAYSNAAAFDVLARVVEVASGEAYDAYLRHRIVDPLGLSQLGFGLAGGSNTMPLPGALSDDPVVVGRGYYSAAAGMWGSLEAYLTFIDIIRSGGSDARRRLVSTEAVRQMTTNQVGELCPGLTGRAPAPGVGFGLGVAVLTDPEAAGSSFPQGTFGWDGITSRRFWCCPEGGWSMVMLVQDQEVQCRIEKALADALR